MPHAALALAHRRRLQEVWRSAGWPCRDVLELDLLAAGLLSRHWDADGRETLRLTDAGLQALAASRARNQAALGAHEALVLQVAREQQRAGRLVWRGLSLRAALHDDAAAPQPQPQEQAQAKPAPDTATQPQAGPSPALGGPPDEPPGCLPLAHQDEPPPGPAAPRWVLAMPDVFSIRHTTVEAYAQPAVHEIKVSRADLLSDLRRPAKGAAYLALSSECWYVLRRGIAQADEIPPAFGVIWADADGLEVARPAPRRALKPPFAVWMALARATALPPPEDGQGWLGAEPSARSP
jgi:hypothetical protein